MPQHLIFLLTAALLSGCGLFGGEEKEPGGPGIIIPWESMEGIKLGDSREKVKEQFGLPTSSSIASSRYRSWGYHEYRNIGFNILFMGQVVDALIVKAPYAGATPEGIGLSSNLEEVFKVYGEPNYTSKNELASGMIFVTYTFCFGGKFFNVNTESKAGAYEERIRSFTTGYFEPLKEDPFSCSN